ncbi:MAG: hypothetical protein CL608_00745 [Anaerolineaceae bacterium]|nr:hypothetical protein [Anaerolineaceae bacterium]
MIVKQWKKGLFLSSLFVMFAAIWLWSSSPNPVYACDPSEGNFLDCDLIIDLPVRKIEKINVYWYENNGSRLCYQEIWVYVYDEQELRDKRATTAPVYRSYGSIGVYTQETYQNLLDDGVIALAPILVFGGNGPQCISWGQGHIQPEEPPELPVGNPEPLDPIDPPLWKEIALDEPLEGASIMYAYGHETEEGFFPLFYVLPLEE